MPTELQNPLAVTRHFVVEWSQHFVVCTECGALVPEQFSKVHDAWHTEQLEGNPHGA